MKLLQYKEIERNHGFNTSQFLPGIHTAQQEFKQPLFVFTSSVSALNVFVLMFRELSVKVLNIKRFTFGFGKLIAVWSATMRNTQQILRYPISGQF